MLPLDLENKKYCCILPPVPILADKFSNQPYGMLLVYSMLREIVRNEVTFLDYRDESVHYCEIPEADFYLFSSTSMEMDCVLWIADRIVKMNPDAVIIVGGPHGTGLRHSEVWGKQAITAHHKSITMFATGFATTYERIAHMICYSAAVKKHNKDETVLFDFMAPESFPSMLADYSVLGEHATTKEDITRSGGGVSQSVIFSLGCPFSCAFCANHQRKVIRKSAHDAVHEMQILHSRYGTTNFKIMDDDLLMSDKWVKEFIGELKLAKIPDLKFLISTRAYCDCAKLNNLAVLRELGLSTVGVGVEWISDAVLEGVNKQTSWKGMLGGIADMHDLGIDVLAYMIFGLPGSVYEQVDRHFEVALKDMLAAGVNHVNMTEFIPLIGTKIYDDLCADKDVQMMVSTPDNTEPFESFCFVGGLNNMRIPFTHSDTYTSTYIRKKAEIAEIMRKYGMLRKEAE